MNGIAGVLFDEDDRRPGAIGNVDESGDHHVLEFHLPLPKTPLFVKVVVEREQLPSLNEPVRGRKMETHVAVCLEVRNMPFDTLGDFLNQLTFGHRFCLNLVVLGRELSVYLN